MLVSVAETGVMSDMADQDLYVFWLVGFCNIYNSSKTISSTAHKFHFIYLQLISPVV